jgi:TetR/AcrR family transcriptional repressor of nem operon
MPRPREFDPDQALEQAMRVFWARGYEGVSVDDLCAATGLSRSSFYAAFGDKRSLYLNALQRYESASLARLASALAGPGTVQARIGRFLDGLIRDIVRGPGRRGCFIGNCAAELAASDPATARRVRHSLGRIERLFARALAAAQAAGEIDRNTDVLALARFITSAIQGLRLVGKTGAGRRTLDDIARTVLAAVR